MKRIDFLLAVMGLLGSGMIANAADPLPVVPATEPARAAATIQMQSGFHAELIAAEPLVTDPVDMVYDENGRAYVVEMRDYPYTNANDDRPWADQQSAPIGRIRILEDTDGDGKFDRSDLFAENLSWPAGIACWKGGVYVAATPDLLYLKDTDGDRKADVRRVVFSGFRKYNVQAIMNNPEWGLDHLLYVAGSSNGGQITSGHDSQSQPLGRNDFCFNPNQERLEILTGSGRFGNSMDDWGNRFTTNIRNPVQQLLFPSRYLRRNRHLQLTSPLQDVAPSGDAVPVYRISPPESWRVIHAERAARESSPALRDTATATGYVTSSSGVTIYRGAAYPHEFYGNAFVGEVAGNLVIRYILDPMGVTFEGRRPYVEKDFLASTDNWFRAVNFVNAPDGTLHLLDMSRQTVEHPWSMPEDLKKRLDLTAGRDRGRIYRLVPPEYAPGFVPPPRPRLGTASIHELVAELENPNSWWRETAHRLVYERQDQTAVPLLRRLLSNSPSPLGRLHALWSLSGLNALSAEDVLCGLHDAEPRVQAHAVRLSESFFAGNPAVLSQVKSLVVSPFPPLRFQLALSLGEAPAAEVRSVLVQLLLTDGQDPWICSAVQSSMAGQEQPLLRELLQKPEFIQTPSGQAIALQIAATVGASCPLEQVHEILDDLADIGSNDSSLSRFQAHLVAALAKGLKRQRISLESFVQRKMSSGSGLVRQLLVTSVAQMENAQLPLGQRLAAMPILEYADFETVFRILQPLVSPQTATPLQQQAIRLLGTFSDPRVPEFLLTRYRSLTSSQQLVVDQLMAHSNWVPLLFDALEAKTVEPGRIPVVRQEIYMLSPDEKIRSRAVRIFQAPENVDLAATIREFQQQMPSTGDATRGLAVYQKNCSNCHRLGEHGFDVGPHLATVKNRSREELLVSILDPNKEIAPNFLAYLVMTKDGVLRTGVVSAESDANLTLRGTDQSEAVIFREDIDEFQNTGKSLMPVGLNKTIPPGQMADLLALLKSQ